MWCTKWNVTCKPQICIQKIFRNRKTKLQERTTRAVLQLVLADSYAVYSNYLKKVRVGVWQRMRQLYTNGGTAAASRRRARRECFAGPPVQLGRPGQVITPLGNAVVAEDERVVAARQMNQKTNKHTTRGGVISMLAAKDTESTRPPTRHTRRRPSRTTKQAHAEPRTATRTHARTHAHTRVSPRHWHIQRMATHNHGDARPQNSPSCYRPVVEERVVIVVRTEDYAHER